MLPLLSARATTAVATFFTSDHDSAEVLGSGSLQGQTFMKPGPSGRTAVTFKSTVRAEPTGSVTVPPAPTHEAVSRVSSNRVGLIAVIVFDPDAATSSITTSAATEVVMHKGEAADMTTRLVTV